MVLEERVRKNENHSQPLQAPAARMSSLLSSRTAQSAVRRRQSAGQQQKSAAAQVRTAA